MLAFLVTVLAVYAGLVAALYLGQRKLQYFPDPRLVEPGAAGLSGFATVRIATGDGESLVAWHGPAPAGRPTVVYFQGNAAGLANRAGVFARFHAAGYGVLGLGYRGYSGSTGSPSEAGLVADGAAAVAWLEARGVERRHIAFYGESLGTGIAIRLAAAAETEPGAVILEAAYTSMVDLARSRYWYVPVARLLKDQYRSLDHAGRVRVPALLLHGAEDSIVPVAMGRAVHDLLAGDKRLVVVPGDHGLPLDGPLWEEVDGFLTRVFAGSSG